MLIDYHTHTYLCKHADGSPEEYIEAAIKSGLSEIGIADHCPIPAGYDTQHRMLPEEFPLYRNIVNSMREKFSDKITIRYGVEADWVPGRMDELADFLESEDFDYVLGSIHYTDEFPFDNPAYLSEWEKEGRPDKIWERYVELMHEMVSSAMFDIIAHFDLPKKFGFHHSDRARLMKDLDGVFTVAASNGMAIEINTSGLRKAAEEMYPSLDILKLASEKGMKLTLGSDAHIPGEVAADFADAVRLAKTAGFTELTVFEKRNSSSIPLG